MKEVKKLIDLGKEKGYLTYDDVNDMLPAEVVSPDQIDDVMSIFGEMDIEVVDSNQRVTLGGVGEDLRVRPMEMRSGRPAIPYVCI
jgi:RNA polymerase primary sigma factor